MSRGAHGPPMPREERESHSMFGADDGSLSSFDRLSSCFCILESVS